MEYHVREPKGGQRTIGDEGSRVGVFDFPTSFRIEERLDLQRNRVLVSKEAAGPNRVGRL